MIAIIYSGDASKSITLIKSLQHQTYTDYKLFLSHPPSDEALKILDFNKMVVVECKNRTYLDAPPTGSPTGGGMSNFINNALKECKCNIVLLIKHPNEIVHLNPNTLQLIASHYIIPSPPTNDILSFSTAFKTSIDSPPFDTKPNYDKECAEAIAKNPLSKWVLFTGKDEDSLISAYHMDYFVRIGGIDEYLDYYDFNTVGFKINEYLKIKNKYIGAKNMIFGNCKNEITCTTRVIPSNYETKMVDEWLKNLSIKLITHQTNIRCVSNVIKLRKKNRVLVISATPSQLFDQFIDDVDIYHGSSVDDTYDYYIFNGASFDPNLLSRIAHKIIIMNIDVDLRLNLANKHIIDKYLYIHQTNETLDIEKIKKIITRVPHKVMFVTSQLSHIKDEGKSFEMIMNNLTNNLTPGSETRMLVYNGDCGNTVLQTINEYNPTTVVYKGTEFNNNIPTVYNTILILTNNLYNENEILKHNKYIALTDAVITHSDVIRNILLPNDIKCIKKVAVNVDYFKPFNLPKVWTISTLHPHPIPEQVYNKIGDSSSFKAIIGDGDVSEAISKGYYASNHYNRRDLYNSSVKFISTQSNYDGYIQTLEWMATQASTRQYIIDNFGIGQYVKELINLLN